jgi:hypothetical protein
VTPDPYNQEERAAIMMYDGNLPREQAELLVRIEAEKERNRMEMARKMADSAMASTDEYRVSLQDYIGRD